MQQMQQMHAQPPPPRRCESQSARSSRSKPRPRGAAVRGRTLHFRAAAATQSVRRPLTLADRRLAGPFGCDELSDHRRSLWSRCLLLCLPRSSTLSVRRRSPAPRFLYYRCLVASFCAVLGDLGRRLSSLLFAPLPSVTMPTAEGKPQTLYDKVFQEHIVDERFDGTILLYIGIALPRLPRVGACSC
jgi:hypothetical protein